MSEEWGGESQRSPGREREQGEESRPGIACGHQMFTCNKKKGEGVEEKKAEGKKWQWFTGVGGAPGPKA